MLKVLYSKYNSTRRPEFATITKIVEENDHKFVVKQPMEKCANLHLREMQRNYEKIKNLYEEIEVVRAMEYPDGGLLFEFIEGKSLADELYDKLDFYDCEDAVMNIISLMNEVLYCNVRYKVPFQMTEQFERLFPGCYPQECAAFSLTNMDCILNNFVRREGKLYCLDYEWIFDFPVPEGYVKYRIMKYIFREQQTWFEEKNLKLVQVAKKAGLSDREIGLYDRMEYSFQEYVHGKGVKYIYLENYKKNVDTIENMQLAIRLKEQHISNLEDRIEKLKRAVKNPLYGGKLLIKQFWKKNWHE